MSGGLPDETSVSFSKRIKVESSHETVPLFGFLPLNHDMQHQTNGVDGDDSSGSPHHKRVSSLKPLFSSYFLTNSESLHPACFVNFCTDF
jgi:hypothetical protein